MEGDVGAARVGDGDVFFGDGGRGTLAAEVGEYWRDEEGIGFRVGDKEGGNGTGFALMVFPDGTRR